MPEIQINLGDEVVRNGETYILVGVSERGIVTTNAGAGPFVDAFFTRKEEWEKGFFRSNG